MQEMKKNNVGVKIKKIGSPVELFTIRKFYNYKPKTSFKRYKNPDRSNVIKKVENS